MAYGTGEEQEPQRSRTSGQSEKNVQIKNKNKSEKLFTAHFYQFLECYTLVFQRRTMRILKFIDKMSKSSEQFHFKEGFFLDLMDQEYLPEKSSTPINLNRPDSKRPLFKSPQAERQRLKTTGAFQRRDSKTEAVQSRFSDCKRAGEVPGYGYVYVKVHTDPFYRYLPPLSDASKNYSVRLAKLPHSQLRNEEQWRRFLDTLGGQPPPKTAPKQYQLSYQEIKKVRTEELKKKLPIITLLPKWLREVRDKNDIRSRRYKNEEEELMQMSVSVMTKKRGNFLSVNGNSSRPNSGSSTASRPKSRTTIEIWEPVTIPSGRSNWTDKIGGGRNGNGLSGIMSHTKEDMTGVIKVFQTPPSPDNKRKIKRKSGTSKSVRSRKNPPKSASPIKYRIRAP